MPFYLVTQTLLVEAENEQEAGERATARIRSGEKITVSVKADEATITHITVAATVDSGPAVLPVTTEVSDQSLAVEPEILIASPADRKHILKRMVADALSLVRPRI
ncbi:hypothetical protein NCHU2750_58960 (plasmid) [Neorhizobium sp. NCHU2750]|nr:hypothetical protein NCHU2750_58960 [Neorhizobium sp. NCHU2750]